MAKTVIIFVLTFFTLACSTEISKTSEIIDVKELRSEISSRFDNLQIALQNPEYTSIDNQIFKKEALKHLLNIEEENTDYVLTSKNYDEAYSKVSLTNHFKENKEAKNLINTNIEVLSSQLQEANDYESVASTFERFYNSTLTSNEFSMQQKNQLIRIGVWHEASLRFYNENYSLFSETSQAKSIVGTMFKSCGWWHRWGKCVAGTLGGYYGGGLVGGAIGAAAAGVGAIPGCAGGAVVGAIGGALTGAAASCDGCSD